jgi:sulfur-carrier protein adenylyltransferase/sulfurtransferase
MAYPADHERYQRQVLLRQFGINGQQQLLEARVLVIGAGGLGCPVLQYLAAAGVGYLGIADGDVVGMSNLHRQILFTENDIGASKAQVAQQRLSALNPGIHIEVYPVWLTPQNILDICAGYDYIVDGSDNFATRYMVNDACVLLGKTLIFGAISQFEGQVAVFNRPTAGKNTAVNYRDIFPHPPVDQQILNCAEAGVLGVLPGIVGTMMANQVIQLIAGIGRPLVDQLFVYNALNHQSYTLSLQPVDSSRDLIPSDAVIFQQTDYVYLCNPVSDDMEISAARFRELLTIPNVGAIDVREPGEIPEVTAFLHQQIPLGELADHATAITDDTILVFCQSGKRSLKAAQILSAIFGSSKKVYSLQGGILHYEQITHT